MALDICFDVQTFLERTCRACSRYFSEEINGEADGGVRFHRIFAEGVNGEDVKEDIYQELVIWQLNIKPSDGLPQKICHDCYERFINVKSFREECLDTQKVLESYFKDFDNLLETGSHGRLSPKADSVKSDSSGVNPALPPSLLDGSPKISFDSPKYNDVVYAESSMGTPPPLFEEIKTEPIDMRTLDFIKAEAELQPIGSPKVEVKIKDENIDMKFKPISVKQQPTKRTHYTSSDDESSTPTSDEDNDDTDEEDVSATTENDDVALRKRNNAANSFNYDPRNPLQCRICFASFTKRSMLKEHHLRAHPQEKPFVCNVCGSAFKSNFLVRQHQLKHNRPDTIKCDLCGKYFRSQLHLQRHAKNFHLTSTYTCHICNEKFENYTQIRFQYHVRQHGEKRFHCQYCDKSFHQKIHLINHERTHSKEQPFSCKICGKAYRQQTACQEHMLTHKDPTPFKCKICQKGFTQRSSLRQHYRTHDVDEQQQQQKTRYQCKFCRQNFIQKIHCEMHQLERHMQSLHSKKRKVTYAGEVYPNEMAHLKSHAQRMYEAQHKQHENFLYHSPMERPRLPSTLDDSDNIDDNIDYGFDATI